MTQFDSFFAAWTDQVSLDAVLKPHLGIDPVGAIDMSVRHISEPIRPVFQDVVEGAYSTNPLRGRSRPETAEERSSRLSIERDSLRQREEYVMERMLSMAEVVRAYLVEIHGDTLS